jgi:hypothetical protein
MTTRFQFPMLTASLTASRVELYAEYAIAVRAGEEELRRGLEAKLHHIADLHQQILGRPIAVPSGHMGC